MDVARPRGLGPVLLGAATAVFLSGACTFGIDTSGLAGGGDAAPLDAGVDAKVTREASGKDSVADEGAHDVAVKDAGADIASPLDAAHDAERADSWRSDASEPDAGPHDANSDVHHADAGHDSSMSSGGCSFALVQAVPGATSNTGTPVMVNAASQSVSLTEEAGDLLVAVAYGGQGPGDPATSPTTLPNMTLTVTDTLGNTYYAAPMVENATFHQAVIQIFYAVGIKSGANTVTATSSDSLATSTLWTGLWLQEYSGIATSDAVDVSSGVSAPSATTSIFPGAMTTGTGCDLVVAAFTDGHVGGQDLNVGAGWTQRSTDLWDPAEAVDNVGNGATSGSMVNASMGLTQQNPDQGWVAQQVAFRSAGGPAPAQPTSLLITTAAQTVSAGVCSTPFTVKTVRGTTPTISATGVSMSLAAGGVGDPVSLFIDPACVYPITSLLIGAGTDSASFYFKASISGSPKIVATPQGGSTLAQVTQTETVN